MEAGSKVQASQSGGFYVIGISRYFDTYEDALTALVDLRARQLIATHGKDWAETAAYDLMDGQIADWDIAFYERVVERIQKIVTVEDRCSDDLCGCNR